MKHAVHNFRDYEIPFYWHPGPSVNLCFPHSQKNKQPNKQKNSLLLWIQDEWEKKNRKQHFIRKSVFPESRELRVSRGILTHFHLTWLLHSRDWQKSQQILKRGEKKLCTLCVPCSNVRNWKWKKKWAAKRKIQQICGFTSMQCAVHT